MRSLLFTGLLSLFGGLTVQGRDRPNIVFILADDLGGHDVGCYGSTFHPTPHIDALAKKGLLFTQAYSASPLCSPTRASILTGQAPARIGITAPVCHVPEVILEKRLVKANPTAKIRVADSVTRLKTEYPTLAEVLRAAGYRTGHFGKWHLGPEPYSPLQQGFEVDLPHTPGPGPGGGTGYFAPWAYWKGQGQPGDHIEDSMAEEAVKFMRAHRDEPFFLNYWAFSVHSPWMAKEEYIDEAASRADAEAGQHNPLYAAMIRSLDDAVGRLTDGLEELGIGDRTLVIFTSDNGAWHNVPKEATQNSPYSKIPVTSNAPFRSGKASIYEGGTRVPLIMRWPGHISADATTEQVVQSTDFFPTLLELLTLPRPNELRFDGVSFASALKGTVSPREPVFCHFPHGGRSDIEGFAPSTSVRRGDWKLIRFYAADELGKDRLELYDLKSDVGEQHDVSRSHLELVQELDGQITDYLQKTEAVVPVANPGYRPKATVGQRQVGIWSHSQDTRFLPATEAPMLSLESLGGDPWMATTALPTGAKGPFILRLTLRGDAKGNGVLYYRRTAQEPFLKERSLPVYAALSSDWQKHEVKIPVQELHALRLDPANGKGNVQIQSLTLHDGQGHLIRDLLQKPQAP